MKALTGLYILFMLMFLINLTNYTLLNGNWDGIIMWLNLSLFIAGNAFYFSNRKEVAKEKK